jgi:hypothetical protein
MSGEPGSGGQVSHRPSADFDSLALGSPYVNDVRLRLGLLADRGELIMCRMKYDDVPTPEERRRRYDEQRRRNVESADFDPTCGPHGAAWTPIWRPQPGPNVSRRRN